MNKDFDKKLSLAYWIVISILSIKTMLFSVAAIIRFQRAINIFAVLITIILFVSVLQIIGRRSAISFLVFLFAMVLFVLKQILFFPSNESYVLASIPGIVVYGIIPFLVLISVEDYKCFKHDMRCAAYCMFTLMLITAFLWRTKSGVGDYSMSFGKNAMLCIVIIEYFAFTENKIRDWVLFFLGTIVLFLIGSRGCILPIITYPFLHILLIQKDNRREVLLKIVPIIIIAGVLYFNYYRVISWLLSVMDAYGVHSRTLRMIINGEITNLGGRDLIYEKCLQLISDYPVFGIGYQGLQGMGYDSWTPHNTYLELLLYYGIFEGGLLICILLGLWIIGLIQNKGTFINVLCIIFFSLYVPRSFVGAGIMTNIYFWSLLAFSIASIKQKGIASFGKRNGK